MNFFLPSWSNRRASDLKGNALGSRLEIINGGRDREIFGRDEELLTTKKYPQTHAQDSDEEIIRRVLSGEREAFRYLLMRHKNQVFSTIMRAVGCADIAEELTQETFLRAYSGLSGFRSQARFSTWLAQIAINSTSTYFSSRAYRDRRRSISFQQELHSHTSPSAERDFIIQQRLEHFARALESLPPRLREVLLLCGIEGHPYDEVAILLAIPVGTVRSRLNSARHRMRELISAEERKNE